MHMKVSDEMKFENRVELSMLKELREIMLIAYFVTGDLVQ